jgi:hypothetical protein
MTAFLLLVAFHQDPNIYAIPFEPAPVCSGVDCIQEN